MIMMIQLYIDDDDDDDDGGGENLSEKLPVDSKHQHPPAHHVPKYQHDQIVPIFNDTQTIPIYVFPTFLAEHEVIFTAKLLHICFWADLVRMCCLLRSKDAECFCGNDGVVKSK